MTHTTYALGEKHAHSVLEGMECVHCEPFSLGEKHAHSVLEGMECVHCEPFSLGKAPLSFVPFLERIGATICPPRLGSSRC